MLSQYKIHTVGIGDTIQSIGLMYGVDWTELVTINGLEYPYIDDAIELNSNRDLDGVAKVGSQLVIPTIGLNIPNKTNNSTKEIEKYSFGCDLDIFSFEESENQTVNLEIEGQLTDDLKGDIKLSEGISNLRQQLIIRLGTQKGALLNHPEFGSNLLDYIGKRITKEILIEINLEIQECLLGDFRVKSVSDIKTEFKDCTTRVECIIHPIGPFSPFKLTHTYTK